MDDLRNHDARPTAHERAWMETDPRPAISRLFLSLAIAIMIAAASSTLLNPSPSAFAVASSPDSKPSSSR